MAMWSLDVPTASTTSGSDQCYRQMLEPCAEAPPPDSQQSVAVIGVGDWAWMRCLVPPKLPSRLLADSLAVLCFAH
jgi:hypothetical protein